jgi:hypothetical protein
VRAPLILGLELAVLYAAGSYAMGRLIGISGFGGRGTVLGRMAFYLLIFPGVVLHESAHHLACQLTGTKVLSFAPFSPRRSVMRYAGWVNTCRHLLPSRTQPIYLRRPSALSKKQ